jgi:hypothetical protein
MSLDNDKLIDGENYDIIGETATVESSTPAATTDAPAVAEHKGASPGDWYHFTDELGLQAHVLPVVPATAPNNGVTPALEGKVGKIPSQFYGNGLVGGIKEWPTREITPDETNMWSNDRRLNVCVRTGLSGVHAIDCDDETQAAAIRDVLRTHFDGGLPPIRTRSNSNKFLLPFLLEGKPVKKAVIKTEHGIIELLGDGQQFVAAGSHASGSRYEWKPELPPALPTISRETLPSIWADLTTRFAKADAPSSQIEAAGPGSTDTDPALLTSIDEPTRKDLESALKHLRPFAEDNSVWSEIGYALRTLAATGRAIWVDFSREAPKHENGAAEKWWESHLNSPVRTDYRHIFTMAIKRGWERSRVASAEEFPIAAPVDPSTAPATTQQQAKTGRFKPKVPDLNEPAPEWVVKHLLQKGGLAFLYGDPGTGKTIFAVEAGVSVARGVDWHGRKVRQGRVVYIVSESKHGFRARLKAYLRSQNLTLEDLNEQFLEVTEEPHLMDIEDEMALVSDLKELGPISLIVVDTWARAMVGIDENASKDTSMALAACKRISDATGACVLVVHHTGKDASRGMRGSSNLKAGGDTEIALERPAKGPRVARVGKQRDAEDYTALFHYELDAVELGKDSDGDPITSRIIREVDAPPEDSDDKKEDGDGREGEFSAAIRQVLTEARRPLNLEELVSHVLDTGCVPPPPPLGKDRRREYIKRAATRMAKAQQIVVDPDGGISLPDSLGFGLVVDSASDMRGIRVPSDDSAGEPKVQPAADASRR